FLSFPLPKMVWGISKATRDILILPRWGRVKKLPIRGRTRWIRTLHDEEWNNGQGARDRKLDSSLFFITTSRNDILRAALGFEPDLDYGRLWQEECLRLFLEEISGFFHTRARVDFARVAGRDADLTTTVLKEDMELCMICWQALWKMDYVDRACAYAYLDSIADLLLSLRMNQVPGVTERCPKEGVVDEDCLREGRVLTVAFGYIAEYPYVGQSLGTIEFDAEFYGGGEELSIVHMSVSGVGGSQEKPKEDNEEMLR
ncbi:hypothetical protein Tco_0866852, partial [Tanacetum coccineum]